MAISFHLSNNRRRRKSFENFFDIEIRLILDRFEYERTMTDLIYSDDQTLEQSGADVRVFGKWSGSEIQISDMSLEVKFEFFSR